jgi:outer membrane protein
MNKTICGVVGALGCAAGLAMTSMPALGADNGPWTVHVRGIYIDTANKSDAVPGLLPKDAIHVSTKGAPDIDFDYRINDQFSAELLLTIPQKHQVSVPVAGLQLGSFKHLPPVLSAKWHFLGKQDFDPYVGVGLNLTLIFSDDLVVPAGVAAPTAVPLKLDSTSTGIAGQAGFDYNLGGPWTFSADIKYVQIGSDVKIKSSGALLTQVKVDPWLFGVGVGYKF